jgi:hypothetical protein
LFDQNNNLSRLLRDARVLSTFTGLNQFCHERHANFTRVFCRRPYCFYRRAWSRSSVREGRALANNLGEDIRECYRHAEHCGRKAKEQSDPVFRQDFLDCERRWLLLARGYELAARMEAFAKGVAPTKGLRVAA